MWSLWTRQEGHCSLQSRVLSTGPQLQTCCTRSEILTCMAVSLSLFFYCCCNYQKCALLNVSHTHMHTAFWALYQSVAFDGGALRWYLILIFREELTGAGRNNTLSDTTSKLPRRFYSNASNPCRVTVFLRLTVEARPRSKWS